MVTTTDMDGVLTRAVAAGEVPGVVALAADDRGVRYQAAFGRRRLGQDAAMTLGTIFGMASMTKPLVAVAALQLVEQGRLALDEPAGERLPELAAVQVLDGFDDAGAPRLRSPRRAVTLRHLLTHTAGFAYEFLNADVHRLQQQMGAAFSSQDAPMVFDPGGRWEYGKSIGWVGRLVEHVSGRSLEDHLRERILGPLGMADTSYVVGPDRRARLASLHQRLPDGSLRAADTPVPAPRASYSGTGLYATGPDYVRFLRMLLGGGQLDGVRLLHSETVAAMARNQIGALTVRPLRSLMPDATHDVEFFPGMVTQWGFGGLINTERAPTGRSAGSWAWAGVNNTYFWIDPPRRLAGVLLTQVRPFGDPAVLDLFGRFEHAVYASSG